MQLFGDAKIRRAVEQLWPELKDLSDAKLQRIAEYRAALSPEAIAAGDLSAGRVIFKQQCANCHTLLGDGGKIGPDLTGAQRVNLNYLLANIVDPSATVSKNFHMSVALLEDGRVLNGIVAGETEKTVIIQTPKERIVIARDEIEELRPSQLSLMPERMLDVLKPDQVRDLIGYLMSPSQVPLPTEPAGGG